MSKYVKKQKNQIYMPAIVLNFEYVLTFIVNQPSEVGYYYLLVMRKLCYFSS